MWLRGFYSMSEGGVEPRCGITLHCLGDVRIESHLVVTSSGEDDWLSSFDDRAWSKESGDRAREPGSILQTGGSGASHWVPPIL